MAEPHTFWASWPVESYRIWVTDREPVWESVPGDMTKVRVVGDQWSVRLGMYEFAGLFGKQALPARGCQTQFRLGCPDLVEKREMLAIDFEETTP